DHGEDDPVDGAFEAQEGERQVHGRTPLTATQTEASNASSGPARRPRVIHRGMRGTGWSHLGRPRRWRDAIALEGPEQRHPAGCPTGLQEVYPRAAAAGKKENAKKPPVRRVRLFGLGRGSVGSGGASRRRFLQETCADWRSG